MSGDGYCPEAMCAEDLAIASQALTCGRPYLSALEQNKQILSIRESLETCRSCALSPRDAVPPYLAEELTAYLEAVSTPCFPDNFSKRHQLLMAPAALALAELMIYAPERVTDPTHSAQILAAAKEQDTTGALSRLNLPVAKAMAPLLPDSTAQNRATLSTLHS